MIKNEIALTSCFHETQLKLQQAPTIVNRGEWLWNSTKFFVVRKFLFAFLALAVHKTQ